MPIPCGRGITRTASLDRRRRNPTRSLRHRTIPEPGGSRFLSGDVAGSGCTYRVSESAARSARPGRSWGGNIVRRTHLSLYYLAGYLLPAGLLLLTAPTFATKLLLSNETYDEPPLRLAGLVLIALGILIVQIIRHRVEALYTTTLVVRSFLSLGLLGLLISTRNPFFGVVLIVVLIGIALTGASYLADRREANSREAAV